MNIGDKVVRKSHGKDLTFEIIDIIEKEEKTICMLVGCNMRIIADSSIDDLEYASHEFSKKEEVFDSKVKDNIKKIMKMRGGSNLAAQDTGKVVQMNNVNKKDKKKVQNKELFFGRPGRILHVDGDSRYLDECLKAYKQLGLVAEGIAVPEQEQPNVIVDLVKKYKADIVVLTGHDGMIRSNDDFGDLLNYRNSKYFVDSVTNLREYEPNYDDLVIFAGACQSCYESILDAGANFASSPKRVLIHCLDPVFLCERIAYTNIASVVEIEQAIGNTLTGIDGIGGLQTRGKYREGFPKSSYI